jgi:integrase
MKPRKKSCDLSILKFYLYSGVRLSTGCRLNVGDFHNEDHGATVRIAEKGDRRRKIGLHFAAAQAIQEYIQKAELASGPLFRARLNSRSEKLSEKGGHRHVTTTQIYDKRRRQAHEGASHAIPI